MPGMGGWSLNHVLRHARLGDFEPELQIDRRIAPQQIVDTHPRRRAQICIDLRATTSRSRISKMGTVPPYQGLRSDDPMASNIEGN
jgi:hypothetical protein